MYFGMPIRKSISPSPFTVVAAARLLLPQDNDLGRRGDISGWPPIENLKLLLREVEVRFCHGFLPQIPARHQNWLETGHDFRRQTSGKKRATDGYNSSELPPTSDPPLASARLRETRLPVAHWPLASGGSPPGSR